MATTLILFSGLPGCGKTTLARQLASHLNIPLFAKDRFQSLLRQQGLAERATTDGYHLMLDMADEQLSLGVSVILDAVFPLPEFREHAAEIARRHAVRFRPIYCYCSDEVAWRERLIGRRHVYVPHWTPVGWEEVERIRAFFVPWSPKEALFVDAMDGVEENLAKALMWVM